MASKLSVLEIQILDGQDEDAGEEYRPENLHDGHVLEEAVFESEVAFHVRFHCRIRSGRTRDSECSRDITELRRN
jgi:hypothetical protein